MDVSEHYLNMLMLMYADDTVTFAASADKLQNVFCNLKRYCTKCRLRVNNEKAKIRCWKQKEQQGKFYFYVYG